MYRVKVNNEFQYEIDQQGTELSLEGKTLEIDFSDRENGATHVIYNNKSFNTELVSLNSSEKTCVVKVNGNTYTIQVEDQFDQLLKQLGLDNLAANKVLEIKAPMPGLVLNVMIAVDQEVSKGDNLLILEAMKMENILKSTTAGVVKKILVKQGDKVEKNQILIQFK
jgi:biotin carboxyl carrier protein